MSDPYKHLDLTPEYNRIITATTNIRDEIRLVRKRAENPDTGLVSSWVMNDLEKAQLAVSLSGASGNKAEEVRKLIETPEPLNGGIGDPAEMTGEDGILGDVEKQREYYLEALGLEIDPEETRALLRVDGKFYWEADGGVSEDKGEVGPIKQNTPYALGEYLGYKSMDASIAYSTAQPSNAKAGPGRVVDIADKTLPNKRWPAPRPEYKSSLDIPNLLADLINPITGAIVAKSILQQKQEAVNAAASPASANPLQSLGATAAKELIKQLPDFAAMTTDREFGTDSGSEAEISVPKSFTGAPDMIPFIGSTIADEGGVPSWVEFPQYQYSGSGAGPYAVDEFPNFMGQAHRGPTAFAGGVPLPYNGKVYSYPIPLDGQFVNNIFVQGMSPQDSNPVTTMSLIDSNLNASYIGWFSATPGGSPHPTVDGVPLVMLIGKTGFNLVYNQAFSLTDRDFNPKATVFPIITKTYYFNTALVRNDTVALICNGRVDVPSAAPRAPRLEELVNFDPTEIYNDRGQLIPIIGGSESHPSNNPPQPESGPNYVTMPMRPSSNRPRDGIGSDGQPDAFGSYDLKTFQEYVDIFEIDTSSAVPTSALPTNASGQSPFTDLKTLVGSPALGQFTNVLFDEEIIGLADEDFPDRAFTAIRINESELIDFFGLDSFDDSHLWRMVDMSIIDSKFTAFGEERSYFAKNFIDGRRHQYKLKYVSNGETPSAWKEEQFQGERFLSATGTPYRLFFIYTLTTPQGGGATEYEQVDNVSMEGNDGTGLGLGSYNGSYDMLPYQSAPNPFNYTIADGTGGSPNLLFSDSSWIVGTKPFNGNSMYSTDIDHSERLSIPFTLPYVVPSDPTNTDNLERYGTFEIGSNRAFQGTPESAWVGIAWISETPGGTPIATPNGSIYKFFTADAGQFEKLYWSGDPGVFDGTYGSSTSNNILNAGICNTPGGELRFFNTAWVFTSLFTNSLDLAEGIRAIPGTSEFESYIIPSSSNVLVDKMIFSAGYPPSRIGPSGLGNDSFLEQEVDFIPRNSYNDRYTFLGDSYSTLPNPYNYLVEDTFTPQNIVAGLEEGVFLPPKISIGLTVPPISADDTYSDEKFGQYGYISWDSNTRPINFNSPTFTANDVRLVMWVSDTPGGTSNGVGRNYIVTQVNTTYYNKVRLINDQKYWQGTYDYFDDVNYPLSWVGNSASGGVEMKLDLINPPGDQAEVRFVNMALVFNNNTTFTDYDAGSQIGTILASEPGTAAFDNFIYNDVSLLVDKFKVVTSYPDSYIITYQPSPNTPTLFAGEKIDVLIAKYTDFLGGFFTRESVEAVDYLPWEIAKEVPYSDSTPTFTPINGVYFNNANTLVPNPNFATKYPAANIIRYAKFGNNFHYQIGFEQLHGTRKVFEGTFEPATRLVIGKDETVIINQAATDDAAEEAGPVKSQDTMLPYLGEAWSNQVPQNVRLSTYGGSRYPDVTEGFISPDIGFDSLESITTDVPRAWYLPLDGKILVYPFSFGKENINTDFQISLKTPTQGEVVTNTDGAGNEIVPVIWISSIPGGAPQTNVAGVPMFITGFDTVLKCQQCFDVSEARTDTMLFPVVTKDYYINTAMVMESTTLDWALDPTTFDVNRDNLIAWQPEDAAPIAGSDNNQLGVLTLLTSALEPLTDFLGDSTTGV